ncbi:MAG TPA: hypothetical protein VN408_16430, partial [Actinoplanes sp.]|nr:hypothetical protein [Actinoplanes sp.]
MNLTLSRRTLVTAAVAGLLGGAVTAGTPASAVPPPISGARVAVHFDLAAGQMPENIVLDRDGSVAVT